MSKQLKESMTLNSSNAKNLNESITKITTLNNEINSIKQLLFTNFKNIFDEQKLVYEPNTSVNSYISQIYNLVDQEIKRLKQQIESSDNSKIKELETRLQSQQKSHEQELEKYKISISDLEQQIKLLTENQTQIINQKLEQLVREYEEKKQKYEQELKKLTKNEYTVGKALEEKDLAQQELAKAKQELANTQQKLEKAQQELTKALNTINSNQQIITQFEEQINRLRKELPYEFSLPLDQLVKNIITNFKNYKIQEEKLSTLSTNNEVLKNQLSKLLQETTSKIENLTKQKQELLQEL